MKIQADSKAKSRFLACALLCCAFSAAHAADDTNGAGAPTPASLERLPGVADAGKANDAKDESAPSWSDLAIDDVEHVITAPARWNGDDWKTVGWSTAAVLGTALVIDHPWRDEMRRHAPNNNPVLKQVERFGAQYSPVVVGSFLAAGALGGDDNTLETGEDLVTASLIASGIVTPTIKLMFGRARPRYNMGVNYFKPFSSANASFPSGHTTEAFVLASVISEHYDSPWVGYTTYGLAGVVGLARTYHDAHFASDVLAGAMIGTAVGRSVVEYNREHRGHKQMVIIPQLAPGVVGVQMAGSF